MVFIIVDIVVVVVSGGDFIKFLGLPIDKVIRDEMDCTVRSPSFLASW